MAERLGWAFPEPLAESVTAFLRTLTPAAYAERHAGLLDRDLATFVDVDGMRDLLLRLD
ncbi:hypothetical protein ACU4GA_12255 [Methylobacterium oryzae CBMB20]